MGFITHDRRMCTVTARTDGDVGFAAVSLHDTPDRLRVVHHEVVLVTLVDRRELRPQQRQRVT